MGTGAAGTTWQPGTRTVDVVIMTAIRLEFDAVLKVNDGAVPGTTWEVEAGPSGLPVAFRSFVGQGERPLRLAVAVAPAMGATATANTLLPLVEALKPRCIAMCGVCAGRRGKTRLGDVIAADRVYYHDTGKQLPDEVEQDLTTYNLRDDWKAALEGLDVVGHFPKAAWFQARPLPMEWRECRALVALREGMAEPWKAVEPTLSVEDWAFGVEDWKRLVTSLREQKLLAKTGRELTEEGRRAVGDLLFDHMGALPDLSPAGKFAPFGLHVAPMGTGNRVIEDERVWSFVTAAMHKTLGLEMESAAVGEVAHRQRQHKLDAVVMKGVMDYADHGRDDHFKEFAARAAAECLLWFLREYVSTAVAPGYDDLLTPGTVPRPSRDAAPSLLLNARYGVVPWHKEARAEILAELDRWADDSERAVGVRLVHSEGGIGKTRLAIEWGRRRRARHEVAGFLRENPGEGWLERLCGLGPPVEVVIDYAERRRDLVELLQRVAAFEAASGPRRRVRVLLLARSDGDWWAALQQRDPALRALVTVHKPLKLKPLASTVVAREAVFGAAAMAFAEHRGQAPILRSPIALDDSRFERVLYLHMAALVAVENGARAEGSTVDAGSLMDEILEHEERFWMRKRGDPVGVELEVSLARQLVAAATLRGGLETERQARKLCEQFEERPQTFEDHALIKLLHNIYESVDRKKYLPGLEPDLLGEGMVLRVAAPPPGAGVPAGDSWIERVVKAGDDETAITTAFTVLGRASATNASVAEPWIKTLLRSEFSRRTVLALRAGKTVGQRTSSSVLGDLLAETLERDGSASIAVKLAQEAIPFPTVSLRRVAEWQSRMLLAHAPGGDDDRAMAARAPLLNQWGIHLSELGQREPALAATREAVELYRTLARRNPDAFQPALATSLTNLGVMLSALGLREPALTATREAVELYRTLARRNPEAIQPALAMSLAKLGTRLSALGQHEPALAATHEAVELYRTLVRRNPEAFQPALAGNLTNLGVRLSELGQRELALVATREAVELYCTLARRNPDAFQPALATCLTNLGLTLSALGQHEPALATTREAVELYRTLARRNPEAIQPDLAGSLTNLGVMLSELGQRELALVAAREAVEFYRTLARRNPETFQPDLAKSLNNLGGRLSELGQREPALAATREAVDISRTLATRNPDAFQPDLASSLTNLGGRLSEMGQREPALVTTREAVELFCTLARRNPDAFQPALAMSLANLGTMLSALGQHEPALAAMPVS